MRQAFEIIRLALYLICGWVWFGSSGVALVALWIFAVRDDVISDPVVVHCTDFFFLDPISFVHVTPLRLVARTASGRFEIYRDEVSAAEWARLRRRCLTAQLATGRSTSS